LKPLQTIKTASDTQTSKSSQPQSSRKPSDDSVIDYLSDHHKGELPGYAANTEKASKIASDKVILESPQQHQPELRPESPNPIPHDSQSPSQSVSDANTLVSVEQTHVKQPIIVALPAFFSEAITDSQPSHEQALESGFTITTD